MSLDQEHALYDARAALWYAHPRGVSTFSACSHPDCTKAARGGRLCATHAESALASVIGTEDAAAYATVIRTLRTLERQQIETIRKQK